MSRLARALSAAVVLCACLPLQAQETQFTLPKKYPWDHRQPKCFMPVPDAPPGFVAFGCAAPVNWPSHGESKQRVDNLLTMQDYDLLQRAEEELGFSRERFADGQYRFDAFISSLDLFYEAWGARGKALAEAWAREKGRGGYAAYALAVSTYWEAWGVRGRGTSNTVVPEAWTIFYRKLEEANALLDSASPKLKAMGPWYVYKMRIAAEHPKLRASLPDLLEAGTSAWPEYLKMYTVPMTYAGPAWGGSYKKMDEIARHAVERNGGKAAIYALVYERFVCTLCGASYTLKNMAADWELMKRGFREVEAGSLGPSMAAKFALLACQMRDRQETLRLYRLAGDDPAAMAQSSDPCRVFAASNP
jgi:hypothetical protein